jgi:hypothetical protein
MRNTAQIAVMSICLLTPLACSGRKALTNAGAGSPDANHGSLDADGRMHLPDSAVDTQPDLLMGSVADATIEESASDLLVVPVGDATFFRPDGPFLPDSYEPPPHNDAGPVDQKIGGDADLIGGCTFDHWWVFPNEGFSAFCGTVGDACQFICGTRIGCLVEARPKEFQRLYCPPADGSPD